MDRMYLIKCLEQLQKEKDSHGEKFGNNPVHANCMPNFDAAIEKMTKELTKLEDQLAAGKSDQA